MHRRLHLLGRMFLPACLGLAVVPVAASDLDAWLAECHPEVRKWATVVRVREPDRQPEFEWLHYRDSAEAVDFWPASTIKIYAVVAAVEWLNSVDMPLESTVTFYRGNGEGSWIQDCARTVPEMVSEVFRRSSNEDYTLLLRLVGIDAINTRFLIPAKGFPHSALMRDYVTHRPVVYVNEEPQRIVLQSADGRRREHEHAWSGISYAEERGATVLSRTTGNCTSTRELADCMRRLLFHERLPIRERFDITAEQARWICRGDPERGVVGLENKEAGPYAWEKSGETVFPQARYFHKAGLISSHVLDVCYLTDPESGVHVILALAARSGDPQVIRDMALAIYRRLRQSVGENL